MARMAYVSRVPLLMLLLVCGVHAQFGMPGMGGGAPMPDPVAADLPLIKCGVCKAGTAALVEAVEDMREKARAHKIHEDDVAELLEKFCDPKAGGKWMTHYDLKEESGRLVLDYHSGPGKCGAECATIARSCKRWLDDEMDAEELVVGLWKGLKAEVLEKKACTEWTKRCAKPDPPLRADREDEEFVEKSEKDIQMERFMEEMQRMQAETGQQFNMFGGDEMDKMRGMMGDEDDYDGGDFGGGGAEF